MPLVIQTTPDPSLSFTSTKRHRSLWSRSQQFGSLEQTNSIFVQSGTLTSASIWVADRPPTVMACGGSGLNSGRSFSQAYKSFGQGRFGSPFVAPATVVEPMSMIPAFWMPPVNARSAPVEAPWSSRPRSMSPGRSWCTTQPPANEKLTGTTKASEVNVELTTGEAAADGADPTLADWIGALAPQPASTSTSEKRATAATAVGRTWAIRSSGIRSAFLGARARDQGGSVSPLAQRDGWRP